MNGAHQFRVTYSIVTDESAQHGDYAESGFLDRDGNTIAAIIGKPTPGVDMTFREAISTFERERDGAYIEADSWPISAQQPPRWFTDHGAHGASFGDARAISVHLPEGLSGASAIRIAKLLGCLGLESQS